VISAGVTASTYADELLSIAQSLPSPFTHRLALAMARPNKLSVRVTAILDTTHRRSGTSHTVAIATSLLLAAQWPLAAVQLVNAELTTFAGRWQLDGPTTPLDYRAAESVAPFGVAFSADQNSADLTIEFTPAATYLSGRSGQPMTVQPVVGTRSARFAFGGAPTNAGGGGTSVQAYPGGRPVSQTSYTMRDNARWDGAVLVIVSTQTSGGQDYTMRIRRVQRTADAIVVETTTWLNGQPQVVTARYVKADKETAR
jgi:hypothetical protein